MYSNNKTAEIFDILSKGSFICSNSINRSICKLYDYIDENLDELYDYFSKINFFLTRGKEYFYFTRSYNKADIERKLEKSYKWIDIVDFLMDFDESFGPGYRFTPSDILSKLNRKVSLKIKIVRLKGIAKDDKYEDSVQKIIKDLIKDCFIELENEISSSYKVLSSFSFLEELISNINIPEELKNEIPE